MKVEQEQPEFRPVLITLETLEEAAKLFTLIGRAADATGNFLPDLYVHLERVVGYDNNPFKATPTPTGAIRIESK